MSLTPLQNVMYVAATGSDSTGTGGIDNPFATYAKATSAAVALWGAPAAENFYSIQFAPGHYSENISVKPNFQITGDPSGLTVLTGALVLDPTFTGTSEIGAGLFNIQMSGSFSPNLATANASQSFISFEYVVLPPTFSVTGITAADHFIGLYYCELSSDLVLTNVWSNSTASQFVGITITASGTGQASWLSQNDAITGAVVVNGTSEEAIVTMEGTGVDGTLTLNGSNVSFSATAGGIPPVPTLTNGAPGPHCLTKANGIGYAAGTPGNWTSPAPITVNAAIDRLAAACVAAGHTP